MSAKVVALAGANGNVGRFFTDAFLKLNAFQVCLLVRNQSVDTTPYQEYKKRGASLHAISYDDFAGLTKALEGVDVLVSCVGPEVITSAQAGVKVFFPSEYGGHFPDSVTYPYMQEMRAVVKSAQDHRLPVARLNNGGLPEYMFIPSFGFDLAKKKATIWGEGNAKASWTTTTSLANVLKSVPISQLENKDFSIEASCSTMNQVVKLWEQKHKEKLQVEYRPLKELEDRIAADPNDIFAAALHGWDAGYGYVGGKDNGLYPEWKPETLESVL
ncbi:unnamed protein product [Rhizoctonia solani]|uniref:NmrA-like domain-containing protein n=1 Tax=Rhizoctonia solani TaxID=456999 RepID=A0A8H3BBG9_9AGAM|nr:unnamed protein product [Rhizoctonia solani]